MLTLCPKIALARPRASTQHQYLRIFAPAFFAIIVDDPCGILRHDSSTCRFPHNQRDCTTKGQKMSLRSNTLDALCLPQTRAINFMYNSRLISPVGYAIVAAMVNDGRIAFAVDGNFTDMATYDPTTDTITARDNSFGEFLDEKAVLIHECTHAMLDAYMGRRSESGGSATMTVLEDETAAYIAGAIFSIETNLTAGLSSPSKEAVAVVKPKLTEIKKHSQWTTGCVFMTFTAKDVTPLQAAIRHHKLYTTNHQETAVHNGMMRPRPGTSPF